MVRDTVSSVGFVRGDVCLSASSTAAHACHIRHALALDERRVKFIPEYFLEMNSPDLHNPTKSDQVKPTGREASNGNASGRADALGLTVEHSNTPTNEGSLSTVHDDTVLEDRDGPGIEKAQSASADTTPSRQASSDDGTGRKTADIKEVWFAGSHSDVYVNSGFIMPSTLNLLVGEGGIARERDSMQEMLHLCGCVVKRLCTGWS